MHTASNPYCSTSDDTYGVETYSPYDGLDRKEQITRADGTSIAHTYYGNLVSSNGGLSAQQCSTSTYGYGYPILMIDETGNLRQTWTDGFGRLIEVDEPNSSGSLSSGAGTCYAYDLNNNLIGVVQQGGSESTCTQSLGGTYNRCFNYDMISRLTSATNPESGTINYSYTVSGASPCSGDPSAACSRTDANGVVTTYCYDALNRLTGKRYATASCPLSSPDVAYFYDQTSYNGLTITNGKGRRTGMSDGSGQTAWSYNEVGNAKTEVRKITNVSPNVTKTVSTTYNYDSSIAQITYPSNRVVTYGTSNAQRQTTATDTTSSTHINYALGPSTCPNGQNWACYAPQGALRLLQNGASLITNSYYNKRLQPCRFAVNASGTIAPSSCGDPGHSGDKFDLQYSFDLSSMNNLCSTSFGSGTNNGDVASITNNVTSMSGRSQNFCYDALNRITLAQTTGVYSNAPLYCWGETYNVDAVANLMAINQTTNSYYTGCSEESGFSITVNGSNHINTSGFTYDSAGNLTAKPGGFSMAYDAENRIGSVPGFTYTYDGDGNRVEKSGSTLYWYGPSGEILTETDTGGNSPVDYVFFAGKRIARVDSSNNVDYYFADQLGSSRVIVQDGTTPALCYDADFYPYGGERPPYTNTCPQNYKFTGKERDSESGLDNFGARYDSSQYGRFMSPDPFNPFALKRRQFNAWISNPQRWNKYAYALNNPVSLIDPDGMNACGTNDDKTCVVTVTIVDRTKDKNGNYNDKYKDVKGNKDYNATATVSVNGKAVGTFLTRTVPSNGDSATIANGTYNGTLYNSPKHGSVILLLNQDNQNRIPTTGPNPAQGGASFADYIELHNAGRAGSTFPLGFTGVDNQGRDVSAGCVLICTPEYRDFLHATGINPGDGSAPQRHFGVVLNTEENDPDQ